MRYHKTITLRNAIPCTIRHACSDDAKAVLNQMITANGETLYMGRYPDEITITAEKEAAILDHLEKSMDSVLLCAKVRGQIVATAGINPISTYDKHRHRGEFGISVIKEFWRYGIGQAMVDATFDCARQMGYTQLELDVVTENQRAIHLYLKNGFTIYGTLQHAFHLRDGSYLDTYLMRAAL